MTRLINTTAPSSPKISMKIWSTGCPTELSIVVPKSWMEKRKLRMTKNPKRAEKPTELITPIGADQEALRVSSDRWADASNPVSVY
jgi:hypothetical protein